MTTTVQFAVRHMGIATVRGVFNRFSGALEIAEDPAASRAWGTVEADSLDTNEDQRDAHLRSADFFDVENHPQIEFTSTRIQALVDGSLEVVGELTLHGVTRELALSARFLGTDTDPWGNERIGLEASGELSRADYGMRFNQALGSGNVLVGDRVKLTVAVSAVRRSD